MITLEQIRLLEGKIARAIELIRILKEENTTLRKGLDSAQKRMKELETLVDGFKSDQKEIESVILRTIKNLDELEESAGAAARDPSVSSAGRKDHSTAGRAGIPGPAGVSSETQGGPSDSGLDPAAKGAGERSQRDESPRSAADVSVETQARPAANPGPAAAPTGETRGRGAAQGVGRMGSFAAPESGNSGRGNNKGELDIF